MQGSVDKAEELKKLYPNSFIPMQFSNPDNTKAHLQTAKEIKEAVNDKEVVITAGIGTGGTAYGLKKYLENAIIYGIEPEESPLFTKGYAGAHKIQGIGANFIPEITKNGELDGILTVKGDDAILQAKELAQKHGVFCGMQG